ncbi:MAG: D-alanyl-D-alanine carboxypeptidase family protein [Acidimicrobiales bacterium]
MGQRDRGQTAPRARRFALFVVAALALTVTAAPSVAQTAPADQDAAEAAKAEEVDAASDNVDALTASLDALNAQVKDQQAQVDAANQQLVAAQDEVVAAAADVAEAEAKVAEVEVEVQAMAVETFVGGGDGNGEAVLFSVDDPTKALRMETMRLEATQSDLDVVDELRLAQDDLEARKADADAAQVAAENAKASSDEQLLKLQNDQQAQQETVDAAEARLDQLLSEQAALRAIGADLDTDVSGLSGSLARAPRAPASSGGSPPTLVTDSDIALAGNGIYVHVSIVGDVQRLLADAAAAGLDLGGGGYRSPESQIAVRKSNCGTSSYAIYQMPASQCRPPTARPGSSMHEQGKAIDFTSGGSLIRSRSGAAWNWLVANAANYGLYNLPSEPWHWSVNGR